MKHLIRLLNLFLALVLLLIITGCDDKEEVFVHEIQYIPLIITSKLYDITSTSSSIDVNIQSNYDITVIERGICWGTTELPTTDDNIIPGGEGLGEFTISLGGFSLDTAYYIRAFATTDLGTFYGSQRTFYFDEMVLDGYDAVRIGTQIWMAKNIDIVTDSSLCYDNNPENCLIYGRLYNRYEAGNVCPGGWSLPSMEEFNILIEYAENYSTNVFSFLLPGGGSKFNALLGGYYNKTGGAFIEAEQFYDINQVGCLWTDSIISDVGCYYRYGGSGFGFSWQNVENSFSVRCIYKIDNE